jgi:hypothetical protein
VTRLAAFGRQTAFGQSAEHRQRLEVEGHYPRLIVRECRAVLKTENVGNGVGLLHLNRIFRTFGAGRRCRFQLMSNFAANQ